MVGEDANYIDLDVFAIGPVVPQLAALFDQYWNSEFVYPLQSIVADEDPPDERRRRFDAWTDPVHTPPPPPPRPGATDWFKQPHVHEELASGKLQLIWGQAEAFADSPEKVINHTRSWSPAARGRPAARSDARAAAGAPEVLVSSPYPVPNAEVIEDIREGRLYGLQITIITNSLASTDEPMVHAGYRRYGSEMLDLGVQLYELVPSRVTQAKNLGPFGRSLGRFHAKVAAVDGKVMFIGSLNFDPRSEKQHRARPFDSQPRADRATDEAGRAGADRRRLPSAVVQGNAATRMSLTHRRRQPGAHRRARQHLVATLVAEPDRSADSRRCALSPAQTAAAWRSPPARGCSPGRAAAGPTTQRCCVNYAAERRC
jgi:hypothetical protein